MPADFEGQLKKYAELALKVGLNLQPGQPLVIADPLMHGVNLLAAPLVREVSAAAYQLGCRLVDVQWRDDQVLLNRFKYAPPDSFTEYPTWQAKGMLENIEKGGAMMYIKAEDPDLLSGQDEEKVSTLQKATRQHMQPVSVYTSSNATNWLVIAAAVPKWAKKVFPDQSPEQAQASLWQAIFKTCRLNLADPVAAWKDHVLQLAARSDYLNHKRFAALRITSPGTGLTIGLAKGHIWRSGSVASQNGIYFTPNLPTEEVFTMPDRCKVEGVVKASRPLSYGGAMIEDFSLTFKEGRVVDLSASTGETILRKMVENDEGAGRLGEVALVPYSSPISQSGLMFYNTLFDENAASHVALGRAYRFNMQGGEAMTQEEFEQAGGNQSLIHVDFMIGSAETDVDGVTEDGRTEPIMRRGEWVFPT